jgi:CheY-like chemotaxis protein
MTSDALSNGGFDVIEAVNGQAGWEALKEHQPDCVVVDLLMPVMTGQEFIRHLREDDKSTPVLVLTSDIQDSARADCESLGISKFLHKPVDKNQIIEDVRNALHEKGVMSK